MSVFSRVSQLITHRLSLLTTKHFYQSGIFITLTVVHTIATTIKFAEYRPKYGRRKVNAPKPSGKNPQQRAFLCCR